MEKIKILSQSKNTQTFMTEKRNATGSSKRGLNFKNFRTGQVTIFIILAVVIVVIVLAYYLLRGSISGEIPKNFQPVYDYYISCLTDTASGAVVLMSEQGGYIEKPEFSPGSSYMPFSSELDFMGRGVPYWLYVSGNNILREQVPVKSQMENQLGAYLSGRLKNCDFSNFEKQGFSVYIKDGEVRAKISDFSVDFETENQFDVYFMNKSISIKNHDFAVRSKLGKYHKLALGIYDYEKKNTFLESYALDVMRLYAPVTGVEISCVPKIFVDEEIRKNITEGLSLNIPSLKLKGNYYRLSSKERDYFVENSGIKVDENINFLYSPDFPTRIEIFGEKVASPVGLQEGMGALGFCYVPYQLIYDINFPVLVQIYDDKELFQFPVAVIISKNQARNSLKVFNITSLDSEECRYRNQEVKVSTYDLDMNPVSARIQYKCLNSVCDIGETNESGTTALAFPQCVNGFVIADSPGFASSKTLLSTNEDDVANIVLRKKYNIDLNLGNVKKAIVNFISEDYSTTVLYPDSKSVDLIESYYNVTVYAYDNSTLKLPAVNDRKCVGVPQSGLSGIFGAETEKCFDINIPETDISFAVTGGGRTQDYFTETQLRESNALNINIPLFKTPSTMEELQNNQIAVEEEIIYLELE